MYNVEIIHTSHEYTQKKLILNKLYSCLKYSEKLKLDIYTIRSEQCVKKKKNPNTKNQSI